MKINWGVIKFILILGLVVFVFSFSNQRNNARNISEMTIEFEDEDRLFISQKTVNKLLIQNIDSVTSIDKDTLVLNKMESILLENPMIKNAEVYITIDGILGVNVTQRKPVARVKNEPDFYLDEDGKKMPLSAEYSARVPIVTGISEHQYAGISVLIKEIENDDFFKELIVGMDIVNENDIVFSVRKNRFKVLFGPPVEIENKFQKFKAFYKILKRDSLLENYSLINLKFKNQVVATKRETNGA
jgi:cell division protein FtsQ